MRLPADEEYLRRFDEACRVAGPGDWRWNERFLSALDFRGLALSSDVSEPASPELYPTGWPMVAPTPYPQGNVTWEPGMFVVWAGPRQSS